MIDLEPINLKCSFNSKEEILQISIWEDSEDLEDLDSKNKEDDLEDSDTMISLLNELKKFLEKCSMNCKLFFILK